MKFLDKLFGLKYVSKIKVDSIHSEPIDEFYEDISIEEISLYQLHFDRIINKIDIANYTEWSLSHKYDRYKLDKDDELIYETLIKAQEDGINGGLLQNMINQFFFADKLEREFDKSNWVRRVIHRKSTDYFPDAKRMRKIMELLS